MEDRIYGNMNLMYGDCLERMKEIELQKGIRDNFIVALSAYIKVGNPEQFVADLETITYFFSKLPSNPRKLYGSLYPNSESYNNISDKVEALICCTFDFMLILFGILVLV